MVRGVLETVTHCTPSPVIVVLTSLLVGLRELPLVHHIPLSDTHELRALAVGGRQHVP